MSERWNEVSERHELRKDPACKPATAAATVLVARFSLAQAASITYIPSHQSTQLMSQFSSPPSLHKSRASSSIHRI